MAEDRKTVFVNDQPIEIFNGAEVQHCVNAYDSALYVKIHRGEAEIVDEKGNKIGWGGHAGDGQHIYVRFIKSELDEPNLLKNPQWIDDLIKIFKNEPLREPPRTIWRYRYNKQTVYYVPKGHGEMNSVLYDSNGNEICEPDGGVGNIGDGRCADFFVNRTDEMLIWRDTRNQER